MVYNGVSAKKIDMEQKLRSRSHIESYTDTLFNFVPDAIFTHVTRLVPSKGVWRDIALLYHLDKIFDANNLKGVYLLVSTLIATGRSPSDVMRMENDYGWPVLHRDGWPDLIATEKDIYEYLQVFNSRSKAIKGVFHKPVRFQQTYVRNACPGRGGIRGFADSFRCGIRIFDVRTFRNRPD